MPIYDVKIRLVRWYEVTAESQSQAEIKADEMADELVYAEHSPYDDAEVMDVRERKPTKPRR